MAKYEKTRFLKYFNRPIVFVSIEVDTIGVFFGIMLAVFIALSLSAAFKPYSSFLLGMIIGMISSFYYSKQKNESSKGYFKHILYVRNIYKVNTKKYAEEVERMDIDVELYYPSPNDKIFIE